MQMENLNFYILTGGPGSGKSTVLKLLSDMGYLTVEETGRNIIQKQIKSLGDAVPWNNVTRYARLMFLHAITDFEELVHVQKTCFFDRGILDILGYCRLINIPITTSLKKEKIPLSKYTTPLLFTIDSNNTVQNIFIPDKDDTESLRNYLKKIKNNYFSKM